MEKSDGKDIYEIDWEMAQMEYVGTVQGDETKETETVKDLGNVENK